MKTLKLSFEDAALEAFEAYAASVKMSPAEILGHLVQDLVNASSSDPLAILGKTSRNVADAYTIESIRLLCFVKTALLRTLLFQEGSTKNGKDNAALTHLTADIQKHSDEESQRLLTGIRKGAVATFAPLVPDEDVLHEMAEEEKLSQQTGSHSASSDEDSEGAGDV